MSLGDDHQSSGGYGGTGQTRTRLPDSGGDGHGGPRRGGRSSSRGLVTVVGVVVLLIAAIAIANRGGDDSSSGGAPSADKPRTSATAPTGTHPVDTRAAGIPTGFAHDRQGAQSAAANYAVALGSDGMFNTSRRHEIVQTIAEPGSTDRLQAGFDADYSADFLKRIGLGKDGRAPSGNTFVSRTVPVGTKVTAFTSNAATVDVWCNGLFGLAGEKTTTPVMNSWFTVTLKLSWSGDDWKVLKSSQRTGPTPVPGDSPVSGASEMSKAAQEFGGFTYAR